MPLSDSPHQLTIEKTPSYLVTRQAPERIARHLPDAKLLIVLRDPVTRAISDYAQSAAKGRTRGKRFEELALRGGKNSSTRRVNTRWPALRLGLYAQHLRRWLEHFPKHQVQLVSGERLISDPAGEMRRVQRFLDLDALVDERHFVFNTTKGFPCVVKRPPHSRPHCLGRTKGRAHPHVDERIERRLREFYRPHNRRLQEITGFVHNWPEL